MKQFAVFLIGFLGTQLVLWLSGFYK